VSSKLEGLAKAGADLEFVIARRSSSRPNMGVLFVTPLVGEAQVNAAIRLGFEKSKSLHAVRVEGPDEPGMAFLITRALAAEGINLRGFSAGRLGSRFIGYWAFDSVADADRAINRINRPL